MIILLELFRIYCVNCFCDLFRKCPLIQETIDTDEAETKTTLQPNTCIVNLY